MTALIEVTGVVIRYGRQRVLEGIDLQVEEGAVYGLLGRNGSGKSSLVRCLLGQQEPESGRIVIDRRDPRRARTELMAMVGYVPEEPQIPPRLTAEELGAFGAAVHGEWKKGDLEARCERFGVALDVPFRRLSKGQKKQLELAWALARRPRILILDDPTLGLDPVARRGLFEDLIVELADGALTVFLTSHDLASVEGVATTVGILKGGQLVIDESLESLKSRFRRLLVRGSTTFDLAPIKVVTRERRQWGEELIVDDFDEATLSALPPSVEVAPMSLEDLFAALDRKGGGQP